MNYRESTKYVMERVKEPMNIVEVGVFQGGNALRLLSLNPKRLYLVDPYKAYNQYESNKIAYVQKQLDEAKAIMLDRINRHPKKDVVTVIVEDSIEASKRFGDGSMDYIYIDGNHSYPSVLKDLNAWYPKVKPGMYLAGHDYMTEATARAVHDFADEKGLEVIGWCKPGAKEVPDWEKDWLIQKPEVN